MKTARRTFILMLLGLAACSERHEFSTSTISSQAASPIAIEAFANTMYSFGAAQGCITCHSVTVNPRWMATDVKTAYAFARPFLDMNNPSASIFAVYAGNNHCNNAIC